MPNRNTFNTLVSAYCRLGWLKKAVHTVKLMTRSDFLPDSWTYSMLISGLCKEGRINEAFQLGDEMEKLKSYPFIVTYYTLISGCFQWRNSCETKHIDKYLQFLEWNEWHWKMDCSVCAVFC